jgi:NAD-reducing hydrogenase small subunit
MNKIKFATVWLDGCSGCHMSFLDMDEKLLEIAEYIDVVCTPYIDVKEFPEGVDLVLVEGAVSSEEDEEKIKKIRKNSKLIMSFGDCAVTGNITALRNIPGLEAAFERAYHENVTCNPGTPSQSLPVQLQHVRPLNEVVKIDIFLPGCPPPATSIYAILKDLVEGKELDFAAYNTRFGR